jgi:hypothetical protein
VSLIVVNTLPEKLNVLWHQNIWLRHGTRMVIGFREVLSIAQLFTFLLPACPGYVLLKADFR